MNHLQVCRTKGVHVELVLMAVDQQAGSHARSGAPEEQLEALAAAWQAAESAFPHLSVTIVGGASVASLHCLASTLLQRFMVAPQLAVSLVFKQPLVGSIRSLPLRCTTELRPIAQSVDHALLCPCHQAPTSWASAGAAATVCAVSGATLDRRQCRKDERTVVVGGQAPGALHLSAPFNITSLASGGGEAGEVSLTVIARLKVGAGFIRPLSNSGAERQLRPLDAGRHAEPSADVWRPAPPRGAHPGPGVQGDG
jgi:hypothetical protein